MANRLIVLGTVAMAALYFYGIWGIHIPQLGDPLGPRAFPILVGIALLAAALMLAIEARFFTRPGPEAAPEESQPQGSHPLAVAAVVAATAIYFWAFTRLGYPLSTCIYLIALTAVFRPGKWASNVATAILFSFASYYLFTALLGIQLPGGVLPV